MSCIFFIAGETLNIDEFIDQSGLKGFTKQYKGEEFNVNKPKRRKHSIIFKCISQSDLFDDQKVEVLKFLKRNKNKLELIKSTKTIEHAYFDFNITSTINYDNILSESMFVDKELISLCSHLDLAIEMSLYAKNLEKILERKYQEKHNQTK